jgi:glycosyltransferase involved in cell wall biosynthesis
MIIACINVYNEEQNIERCLQSLIGKVDKIIVVDGAYKDYPHAISFSTDRTVDIALSYGADVISKASNCAWGDEVEKRNAYLDGKAGDYYFVIDADEELVGDLKGIDVLDDWSIKIDRLNGSELNAYRIFKHRPGICYKGAHNALFAGESLLTSELYPAIESGYIKHYIDSRPAERKESKSIYYRRLKENESNFRSEHGL